MRLLYGAVLIFLLTLGQAHACVATWVLPDGKPCKTCPALPCPPQASSHVQRVADEELGVVEVNDCHVCCNLTSCTHQGTHVPVKSSAPVLFVIALPAQIELIIQVENVETEAVTVHIESALPNAPPILLASRAPPFQLD